MNTAIIILNWNGGADTIDCLKTVIDTSASSHIIVWDNHSTDNSVAEIGQWLSGNNISYTTVSESEITQLQFPKGKVSLVTAQHNYGFAKGVNYALRQIIQSHNYAYAWLLNNDAMASPQSLQEMVKKMEEDASTAFVGSVILDGNDRNLVQCCGVKYFKYFGVSKLQFKDRKWTELRKEDIIANKTDYQNGASLLVRMSALNEIGLMDERFFLYSEEHDWQFRAAQLGYKNVIATDSIIYHKGSMSTESKKHLFYYYYNRSAILFSRKHCFIITTLIASIMLGGITVVRARLNSKSMKWGFKGIFEGWLKKTYEV